MFSSLKIANFAARRFFYHTKKQELSDYQSNAFERLGLNYLEAKNLTNKVCQELFGSTFNNSNGMHSEHLVYFSALKLSGFKPKNILEIGTFKGETSSFIAKLFPDSMIRTLDISIKEMKEKNIYLYAVNSKEDLNYHRMKNFKDFNNISFNELNSLLLTYESNEYDLIWLDGAHGYPIATVDLTNSLRLLSKNGKLVCDDVYLTIRKEDSNYFSLALIETLNSFKSVKAISFELVLKRVDFNFNFWKNQKKYIAIVKNEKVNHL